MTERKQFKRRVRARMEKTGERYTAARRHVLEPEAAVEPGEKFDGVSDEAVIRRTGKATGEWFALLDAWGATARTHGEIARHLQEEHGVPGWWAQSVTVLYERARGLRAKHEGPQGFGVGASRTVAVPVERLYAAFVEEEERDRWLPPGSLRLRTAQPGRSARFDWENGRTRVIVGFTAKGEAKSAVAVQHERLSDADEAERTKEAWRERLTALKALLEG
jgi:hypothetical protein